MGSIIFGTARGPYGLSGPSLSLEPPKQLDPKDPVGIVDLMLYLDEGDAAWRIAALYADGEIGIEKYVAGHGKRDRIRHSYRNAVPPAHYTRGVRVQ